MSFLRSFKIQKLIDFLPYIFVFISSLYQPWDADLGWHLKYGEYFFQHGRILKENIFSTEMTNFIWPNTSWGIDLFYFGAFHLFGFLGLTLLCALVITLTFYFFSKAFDLNNWHKALVFPFLVILEKPVNEISFRGQVVSVMMLGILMLILARFEKSKNIKSLIWLMPLFLVWANLHGQFILGMGVLFLWIALYFLAEFLGEVTSFRFANLISQFQKYLKTNSKQLLSVFLILIGTVLATLIHPFGFGIYTDAFLHFKNQDLQYIIEYLPFDDLTQPWWYQMIFGIFVFLGILYLFFFGQLREKIPYLGVLSVLYPLSWIVRRYAWSMYFLGIPFLKPVADFLKPDSEKNVRIAAAVLFIFYTVCAVYLKLPLNQFTTMDWQAYCLKYTNCSDKSIEFIRDNKLTDKLLSLYGWGGYMIWNYPDVKPSMDGRMHLWKDEKGFSAFSEYYAIEQNWKDVDKSKYNVVLMPPDKPIYDRLEKLVKQGKWIKAYEDEYAGVFVRNATPSSEFILDKE